jgi:hypothetical protein
VALDGPLIAVSQITQVETLNTVLGWNANPAEFQLMRETRQ